MRLLKTFLVVSMSPCLLLLKPLTHIRSSRAKFRSRKNFYQPTRVLESSDELNIRFKKYLLPIKARDASGKCKKCKYDAQ